MQFREEQISATEYLVQADSFARGELWEKWHDRYRMPWRPEGNLAFGEGIGVVDGYPIKVHVSWAVIGGFWVGFWEQTSLASHTEMVRTWLKKTFPKKIFTNGREGSCSVNALNFHIVVQDIEHRLGCELFERDPNPFKRCDHCGRRG